MHSLLYVPIVSLALLSNAPAYAAEDYDSYGDGGVFEKKFPDLSCVDRQNYAETVVAGLPDDNIEAGKALKALGRQTNQWPRKQCFSDRGGDPGGFTNVSGSEFLDRLYSGLTSGPIPHGFFKGVTVVPDDVGMISIFKEMGHPSGKDTIEKLAETLWSGKYFDRNRMFLKNRINIPEGDMASQGVGALLNPPQNIQEIPPPQHIEDRRMMFPAKLYCGQSLFDSRRESIIIDYYFGVEDGAAAGLTVSQLDVIAGPKGLQIRDEVRKVRDGLYLGRAYIKNAFGLYFILAYVPGTSGDNESGIDGDDACWIGHQRQMRNADREVRSLYSNDRNKG